MFDDPSDLGPRKKFAQKLARDLIADAEIVEVPVSLKKIIEHLQNERDLRVHKIDIGDKVSGLLVLCRDSDSEYATIAFNSNHPWSRRRFTIAHEIGHLLLGHTCIGGEKTHAEREADFFAAELLVPKDFIKKDFKTHPDIEFLAKEYRVSAQSLSISLMENRLL